MAQLAKSLNIREIPSMILGVFAFFVVVLSERYSQSLVVQTRELISPPPMLERFSFGYSEVLADSLWIRALQDFDYCEQEVAKKVCVNNTWLYKMLDAITTLSPHFRMPYATGGLALSVLVNDIEGGAKFYNKGVKAFPTDWPILYRAAYHFLYEVQDKKRAAELLVEAGKYGAPPWVFTLAGRLFTDEGSLDLAKALLQEMIETKQDSSLIKRLQEKIATQEK